MFAFRSNQEELFQNRKQEITNDYKQKMKRIEEQHMKELHSCEMRNSNAIKTAQMELSQLQHQHDQQITTMKTLYQEKIENLKAENQLNMKNQKQTLQDRFENAIQLEKNTHQKKLLEYTTELAQQEIKEKEEIRKEFESRVASYKQLLSTTHEYISANANPTNSFNTHTPIQQTNRGHKECKTVQPISKTERLKDNAQFADTESFNSPIDASSLSPITNNDITDSPSQDIENEMKRSFHSLTDDIETVSMSEVANTDPNSFGYKINSISDVNINSDFFGKHHNDLLNQSITNQNNEQWHNYLFNEKKSIQKFAAKLQAMKRQIYSEQRKLKNDQLLWKRDRSDIKKRIQHQHKNKNDDLGNILQDKKDNLKAKKSQIDAKTRHLNQKLHKLRRLEKSLDNRQQKLQQLEIDHMHQLQLFTIEKLCKKNSETELFGSQRVHILNSTSLSPKHYVPYDIQKSSNSTKNNSDGVIPATIIPAHITNANTPLQEPTPHLNHIALKYSKQHETTTKALMSHKNWLDSFKKEIGKRILQSTSDIANHEPIHTHNSNQTITRQRNTHYQTPKTQNEVVIRVKIEK